MHHVYVLKGDSGRHYLGMTAELERRLAQHRQEYTYTTRRLGGNLQLVASKACSTREEAVTLERRLKAWKNTAKVIAYLSNAPIG